MNRDVASTVLVKKVAEEPVVQNVVAALAEVAVASVSAVLVPVQVVKSVKEDAVRVVVTVEVMAMDIAVAVALAFAPSMSPIAMGLKSGTVAAHKLAYFGGEVVECCGGNWSVLRYVCEIKCA